MKGWKTLSSRAKGRKLSREDKKGAGVNASASLNQSIAVVTGASRGLGFALAERLGAAGAQIVAVARTVGGLEELDDRIVAAGGPNALLVPLDLADGDGVDRLGAALFERFGRVDILAHCAAQSAPLSPIAHGAQKDVEKAFAVNAEATRRLIRSLDLLLRQSSAPRLLYTADRKAGERFWGAYGASKAAGEAYVASYVAETKQIIAHIVEPPPMPTALRARSHPGEDRSTLTPAAAVADQFVTLLS